MTADLLIAFVASTAGAATPLVVASMGELVTERSGVLNLGMEGMMLVGAVAGFAVAFHSQSTLLALLAGAGAAALLAAVFGWLVIWVNANQTATGLAVSLFGGGFSAFVGVPYVGQKLGAPVSWKIPLLGDIPFIGPALFQHHPMVYATVLAVIAAAWFFDRTRAGLVLRAVGESPESAHALGYKVRLLRLAAVACGGALCGVAGAYLSTVYTPLWVEGMVAGRGWIALALTVFATWRPLRILAGAYLFGGVTMLQLHLQGLGVQIPSQFLSMLPYVATVVVLVLISRNPLWLRANMPASLGKPFHPGS